MGLFPEGGEHVFWAVEYPHFHLEVLPLQFYLGVPHQHHRHRYLALQHRQMLSDAVALARTEGEVAEGLGLVGVDSGPPLGVEAHGVVVELSLVVVGFDLEGDQHAGSHGDAANVVVLNDLADEDACSRTVHPEGFLLHVLQVAKLF